MNITEIRRERLRQLIERQGATKLSTTLGYKQPTFLSQMTGPNPTRDITEKSARKFEQKLGLKEGYLDTPLDQDVDKKTSETSDTNLVTDVIRLVGTICSDVDVALPPVKFADVVALAYIDTIEHDGVPRPDHIKQIVRLLK